MAKSTAQNAVKQVSKKGMNMLINAGGAAIGIPPGMAKPMIGLTIGLIALVVGSIIAVGFSFGYFLRFLRHFNKEGGNGGNPNALTVVSTNATIYVNLVYPSGSECTSKFGGSYIFKKDDTEVACSAVTTAQRNDSGFVIGTKLGGAFYAGAAAANDLDVFSGGARFPGSPSASSGTTHWLYIPGYHNPASGTPTVGVPVVGVIANTNTTRQGPNGEDLTLRYDLMVKNANEANAVMASWGSTACTPSTDLYDCAVSGVTIKFGRQNTTNTSGIIGIAEAELGKREVNGTNQGPEINKYFQGNPVGQPWCAYFVTWVLGQARTGVPSIGGTTALANHFRSHYTYFEVGKQVPQAGDVFFQSGHAGIVTGTDGNYVLTIDGNTGGGDVERQRYPISSMLGFGRL